MTSSDSPGPKIRG